MTEHSEHEIGTAQAATPLTRRELIRRAAIVGGVAVWGVPLVRLAANHDDGGGVNVATARASERNLVAAAFPADCVSTSLDDPNTTRLICAKSARSAESLFKAKVKTECAARCAESASCTAPAGCTTDKRSPITIDPSGVICTETPNLAVCSPELYARGFKTFSCVAAVTCNCGCR